MISIANRVNRHPDNRSESGMSFDGLGSDIEHSSTSSTDPGRDSQNYWLGKKCFDYLVAESLVSKTVKCNSMENLEVRNVLNHEHMRRFPYARCLENLAEGEAQSTASPYKDLMHIIGQKCGEGAEGEWTTIASTMQRYLDPSQAEPDGEPSMNTPSHLSTNTAMPDGGGVTNVSPASDLFTYSMALKEHCDQQGEMMRYNEKCLRAYPPYFKATVHIQGLSFDGNGSSKKMARHHASREACVALHIEP